MKRLAATESQTGPGHLWLEPAAMTARPPINPHNSTAQVVLNALVEHLGISNDHLNCQQRNLIMRPAHMHSETQTSQYEYTCRPW